MMHSDFQERSFLLCMVMTAKDNHGGETLEYYEMLRKNMGTQQICIQKKKKSKEKCISNKQKRNEKKTF